VTRRGRNSGRMWWLRAMMLEGRRCDLVAQREKLGDGMGAELKPCTGGDAHTAFVGNRRDGASVHAPVCEFRIAGGGNEPKRQRYVAGGKVDGYVGSMRWFVSPHIGAEGVS
jgi:hypothetical protein